MTSLNLQSSFENGCHFGHGFQRGVDTGQVFTLLLPLFLGTLGCLSFVPTTNTIVLPSAAAPGEAGKGRGRGKVEGFSSFRVRVRGLYNLALDDSQNNTATTTTTTTTTTESQNNNPLENNGFAFKSGSDGTYGQVQPSHRARNILWSRCLKRIATSHTHSIAVLPGVDLLQLLLWRHICCSVWQRRRGRAHDLAMLLLDALEASLSHAGPRKCARRLVHRHVWVLYEHVTATSETCAVSNCTYNPTSGARAWSCNMIS